MNKPTTQFPPVVKDIPLVIDITGPRQKGKTTLALALVRLLKNDGYTDVITVMHEPDVNVLQAFNGQDDDAIARTPIVIIDSGHEQWHYQGTAIKGYFRAIDLTKLDQPDMDLEIERLAVLAESRGETGHAFMLRQALTAGNIDPAKAYSAPTDEVEAEDVVPAVRAGISLAQYVKKLVREHPLAVKAIAGDSNQWGIHSIEPYARMVDCILRNTDVTESFSCIDALLRNEIRKVTGMIICVSQLSPT